MHRYPAWCPLCYIIYGRGVFEEERAVSKRNLCSTICASQDAKVHAILTMLSQMKPGKTLKFGTITGTFVFHCVSQYLLRSLHSAAVPCAPSTTIHGYDKYLIAFLYKGRRRLHIYIYIYMCIYTFVHTNTSSVSDCHCQD